MSRLAFIGLACLLSPCWGQRPATPQLPKPIPVSTYGFSIERPEGWLARVAEDGLPILVNFPWPEMQAQLTLPAGGAIINVISWNDLLRRRGDDTLFGWAKLDAVRAADGTVISTPLEAPQSTAISEALLVSFNGATFGPDDQAQREVSLYWTYRHEKFAAHMSYLVGDARGEEYERILKQMVFSIRPL